MFLRYDVTMKMVSLYKLSIIVKLPKETLNIAIAHAKPFKWTVYEVENCLKMKMKLVLNANFLFCLRP